MAAVAHLPAGPGANHVAVLEAALAELHGAVIAERTAYSRRDNYPDAYRAWCDALDRTSRALGVAGALVFGGRSR